MNDAREGFSDADLQALVDGELTAGEREAVLAWVASAPAAQARLLVLRAVHDAVADFAGSEAQPAAGPVPTSSRSLPGWRLWLAAAAVVVVVVLMLSRPHTDARVATQGQDRAENELCALQAVPLHGGSWPMFSAIAFELHWHNKGGAPLCVRGDAAAGNEPAGAVPLQLECEVRGPLDRHWQGRVAAPPLIVPAATPATVVQRIELSRLHVRDAALAPIFGVGVDGDGWRQDPNHGLLFGLPELPAGERRFVPQQAGDYRIRIQVPATGQGKALMVETTLRVEAEASAWSEPVDGLRARLVAACTSLTAATPTALALQLRNDSGRMRQYNVIGTTLAPIPQPYHFDLVVDGVTWQQDERRATSFSSDWMFAEQPDGTLRSIVVLPEQWQHDGVHLTDLPGEHRLQFHFHFVPTLWTGGDSLWQGEVTTPELKVTVTKAK